MQAFVDFALCNAMNVRPFAHPISPPHQWLHIISLCLFAPLNPVYLLSASIYNPIACLSHLCICLHPQMPVCALCVSICNAKHCLYRFVSVCWCALHLHCKLLFVSYWNFIAAPQYLHISFVCILPILPMPVKHLSVFAISVHPLCLFAPSTMCACTAKRLLISFCCLLHHNSCTSLFVTLTLPIDCIRPLCVCLQLPMPAHFFLFVRYQCLHIFFWCYCTLLSVSFCTIPYVCLFALLNECCLPHSVVCTP